MANDDKKHTKSTHDSSKKPSSKPKGRSFCCSIFIYTFVFVSGVIVATILPDLAGHHFKQPYGKEYGVMAEKLFKDLPKHLTTFSETAVVIGRDFADRLWDLKAEVERRIAEMSNKKDDTIKTKTSTQRSTTGNKAAHDHDHSHKARAHDAKQASASGNSRPTKNNEF
ncbi:unnamed protein product [Adineta steineri]|uniref:Uncharacterized protein n=1 Tax=Adineta steineri TaxID=433720 RepID=A0A814DPQ6_9BILA|nr:unnamed protein product [Adineta steineri]CAF3540009.1 unnamed protein product [Adineta steineri]CAF4192897.1 unnamed protein product [Adineta steineri]